MSEELVERVAKALSVPEHHTGWRYLSETDRSLYYMQADYALKELAPEIIEALDMLVRAADTDGPEAGLAITNASLLRAKLSEGGRNGQG